MRLEGIALFVFVGLSMLLAAAAIGMSVFFLVVLARFERVRQRQAGARSDFVERLLRGLARKKIQDLGDVHSSYRAFFGVDVLRGSHLEDIAESLQGAAHRIAAESPELPKRGEVGLHLLPELIAANQRALEVERMCVPFSGTPAHERGILAGILAFPAEDKAALLAKLDELAKAIRFRQDTVERMSQERTRSLQLARWGWYGTLALAILAAILGLLCLGA
jgi:hypothetical protein